MKKLFNLCMGITTLFFFTSFVNAADLYVMAGHQFNSNFTVAPVGQLPPRPEPYPEPGTNIELQDGQTFNLGFDVNFRNNPDQRIGLFFTTQDTNFQTTATLTDSAVQVTHFHFTATNFYPQKDTKMTGFVTAGIGAAYYKVSDSTLRNVTRISAQIGAGFTYQISNKLLFQMDARWVPTFFSTNTAIFCNGGCAISINSNTFDQFLVNAGLRFQL